MGLATNFALNVPQESSTPLRAAGNAVDAMLVNLKRLPRYVKNARPDSISSKMKQVNAKSARPEDGAMRNMERRDLQV